MAQATQRMRQRHSRMGWKRAFSHLGLNNRQRESPEWNPWEISGGPVDSGSQPQYLPALIWLPGVEEPVVQSANPPLPEFQ